MRTLKFSLLSLSLCMVLIIPASASPDPPLEQAPQPLGEFPTRVPEGAAGAKIATDAQDVELVGQTGGAMWAVALQGDYAYAGAGPRLVILNVGEPAHPTIVGRTDVLSGVVEGVAVAGNYAYIADGYSGLRIIDVSNPLAPTEAGFYDTPGYAYDVALAGNHAYVADIYSLRIIDVANPLAPTEVGFYYATSGHAHDVVVAGNYAYVAVFYGGLSIIDVSNPSAPSEAGFYDTPGYARAVAVAGNYAYVAADHGGLRIIDVSNPLAPSEAGFCDTPRYAVGVAVAGNYAYVADEGRGLRIIDVSNPLAPTETSFSDTPGYANDVAVAGSYAYVADRSWGLFVVSVASPVAPTQAGFYHTGCAEDVAVLADYAYVAHGVGGPLGIIDVSNPLAPTEVGFYDDTLGYANDVALAAEYAYVAGGGLRIIDVSNPLAPTEAGFYGTPGSATGVVLAGNYAYIADGDSGLRIIDVSNPLAPTEAGFCDTPGYAEDVVGTGDYAYVADNYGGLSIINVSDPLAPTEAGFWVDPWYDAYGVAVAGNYAYVADTNLRIIDVSNPLAPTEAGFYETPGFAYGAAVAGNYAYVADGESGLRIIDVSDPLAPTEAGFYDTPGYAYGVTLTGDYVYLADWGGGLFILRYTGGEPPMPTISGKVTDGHHHSLPGVFVGLLKDADASYVMTTTTDTNGNYIFSGVPSVNTYIVRVILRDGSARTQIHWGQNGLLVSGSTQPFSFETTSITKNIDFGDASLESSPIPTEQLDDLAAMYYHTRQVEEFIVSVLAVSGFQPAASVWGFAPVGSTAFYNPPIQSVTIGDGISEWASISNGYSRPMNREWHENFHHLMNVTIGMPPFGGGQYNHEGFDNPTTDDSWAEGWAEFWPCVLWDALGYPRPYLYRWRAIPTSFEYNWQVWHREASQSREEFAVASLLWDLYDPKEPSDSDRVDLSLNTLWSVIGQTMPDNDLTDMRDVYNALWQATLTNEDGTPVTGVDIDEVFVAHGFYADLNANRQWDSGEEVGWAGLGYRRNTPEVPNAYVGVNVEDENGDPIENSSLLVEVRFENSYYDYSWILDLDNAAGNMVSLGLPPTPTVATADLTVIYRGGRSDTHTIQNSTYWDEVISSTNGYAEEHTFVIRYNIHLPVVLKDSTP